MSRNRYPTLADAAAAECVHCGGPAPAGPDRTCHPFPDGWAILCATCSSEHYQAYRSARVAAELAERASRPKPPAVDPGRAGDDGSGRTVDEPYRLHPDRTFLPRRRRR